MRARSWMAALALIGAASILIGRGLSAQSPGPTQEPSPSKDGEEAAGQVREGRAEYRAAAREAQVSGTHFPTIQVNLVIAGLGTDGCDVEVKPANAGCKFRPSGAEHVSADGRATVKLRDVELRGADKTCTMAITVREPGQPAQTIYRGFRPGSSKSGAVPSFTCFISSRLAGADAKATRK